MSAQAIADSAINGLNTLMLVKINGKEVISDKTSHGLFIEKNRHIREFARASDHSRQEYRRRIPPGLPQEEPKDELYRKVLETGKTETLINREGIKGSLRTVMPFIAKTDFRSNNCMKCHSAEEGETIGAASITLDIQ